MKPRIDKESLDLAKLRAMAEAEQEQKLAQAGKDLERWLAERGLTLVAVCGFNPQGLHVSQIRLVVLPDKG